MRDPWMDILARVRSREDLTWEQQDIILEDYRAEAREWSEMSLNYIAGEGMRAHDASLSPHIPTAVEYTKSGRPRKPIVHGTVNAYNNRGCRCDRCRATWSEHCRERRKSRWKSRACK